MKEDDAAIAAEADTEGLSPEGEEKKVTAIGGKGFDAKHFVEKFKFAKLSDLDGFAAAANSPDKLELLWKKVHAREYPGEFVKSWTGQMRGQAKHLANACPPGETGKVMRWALENWPVYTSEAHAKEGAYNPPERPHMGFLLKYVQSAVTGFQQASKKKSQPKKPKGAVSKPTPFGKEIK